MLYSYNRISKKGSDKMAVLLKESIEIQKKKNINYIVRDGETLHYEPWISGIFAGLYDNLMRGSVFPRKLGADYLKHYDILKDNLSGLENKKILEIGTGSGLICEHLQKNNAYYGSDVSDGLLKRASKILKRREFKDSALYHCSGDDLPFKDDQFDIIICNLTMNFFPNADLFISEIKRTLKVEGGFFCSVPVPERKPTKSNIQGKIYSEETLREMFQQKDFFFSPLHYQNGAILYFVARKQG
jgi:ubiquinone/menaquinone biosynthesis C-methylase UbiE